MNIPPRAWTLAILAGLLWLTIGVVQKMGRGQELLPAVLSELPVTAIIFVVALLVAAQRNR